MTRTMVSDREAGWGEARAGAKSARKARRRIVLAASAAVLVGGIDFLRGFYDGLSGAPRGASAPLPQNWADAVMVTVLVVAGLVTWRNWRETDEMQRLLAIQTWAVIGLSGFLLNPLIEIASRWMPMQQPAQAAWLASAAAGMVFYAYRRVRA